MTVKAVENKDTVVSVEWPNLTVDIQSVPAGKWTLQLDGKTIGEGKTGAAEIVFLPQYPVEARILVSAPFTEAFSEVFQVRSGQSFRKTVKLPLNPAAVVGEVAADQGSEEERFKALVLASYAYIRLGDSPKALEALEKVTALRPRTPFNLIYGVGFRTMAVVMAKQLKAEKLLPALLKDLSELSNIEVKAKWFREVLTDNPKNIFRPGFFGDKVTLEVLATNLEYWLAHRFVDYDLLDISLGPYFLTLSTHKGDKKAAAGIAQDFYELETVRYSATDWEERTDSPNGLLLFLQNSIAAATSRQKSLGMTTEAPSGAICQLSASSGLSEA